MIRAAGLFLMVAGAVFALGWVWPKRFSLFMSLAFALGGFAAYCAPLFPPRLGPVPGFHYAVLVAAILIENAALIFMYRKVKDERRSDAWLLMIVGAHFLPMAIFGGPLMIGLALACMGNAALALSRPNASITPFGLADSALKIGFGAAMFGLYPR
jgi:hypothetical protein